MSGRPHQRAGRKQQRGVTRFEAKLAALAIALTVTGAVFALSRAESDHRVQRSQQTADQILSAAAEYLSEQGSGCPTISSLKRDKFLAGDVSTSDAWGERFRIQCLDREVTVHSAGPDTRLNSRDDVRATRSRG